MSSRPDVATNGRGSLLGDSLRVLPGSEATELGTALLPRAMHTLGPGVPLCPWTCGWAVDPFGFRYVRVFTRQVRACFRTGDWPGAVRAELGVPSGNLSGLVASSPLA